MEEGVTMLNSGEGNGIETLRRAAAGSQDRLALARMLLWAEQEAESLGTGDAACAIREAISALSRG